MIKEYSSVSGYKINTHRSVAFIYTNNNQAKKTVKDSIPFTVVPKKMKYLGVNLTKDVKDLYKENYEILRKEIAEDVNKWKNIHAHGWEESTLLKCLYYPKQYISLMQFLLKLLCHILKILKK